MKLLWMEQPNRKDFNQFLLRSFMVSDSELYGTKWFYAWNHLKLPFFSAFAIIKMWHWCRLMKNHLLFKNEILSQTFWSSWIIRYVNPNSQLVWSHGCYSRCLVQCTTSFKAFSKMFSKMFLDYLEISEVVLKIFEHNDRTRKNFWFIHWSFLWSFSWLNVFYTWQICMT